MYDLTDIPERYEPAANVFSNKLSAIVATAMDVQATRGKDADAYFVAETLLDEQMRELNNGFRSHLNIIAGLETNEDAMNADERGLIGVILVLLLIGMFFFAACHPMP